MRLSDKVHALDLDTKLVPFHKSTMGWGSFLSRPFDTPVFWSRRGIQLGSSYYSSSPNPLAGLDGRRRRRRRKKKKRRRRRRRRAKFLFLKGEGRKKKAACPLILKQQTHPRERRGSRKEGTQGRKMISLRLSLSWVQFPVNPHDSYWLVGGHQIVTRSAFSSQSGNPSLCYPARS